MGLDVYYSLKYDWWVSLDVIVDLCPEDDQDHKEDGRDEELEKGEDPMALLQLHVLPHHDPKLPHGRRHDLCLALEIDFLDR